MTIGDIVWGLAAGVGIRLKPDEKIAYYVEWSIGELCRVNVENGQVTRVRKGFHYPEDVLVDWETDDIFVSERTGEIRRVWGGENSEVIVVPGGAPHQLVLVKKVGKRYLYTVCFDSGKLICIDVAAKTQTTVFSGLGHPVGLAIDSTETYAYITEQDTSSLIRVDLSSLTKTTVRSGLTAPFYLAWTHDATALFCVQRDPANSLIKIGLGSPATVSTVAAGLAWRPSGVAPNSANDKIYICTDQKLQVISFDGVPTITPDPQPFEVYSTRFYYENSKAIPMKDHVSDTYIHIQPEWIKDTRDEPAAYVRGTLPVIKVVFHKLPGYASGTYAVGAIGILGGIRRKDVTLTFDAAGMSQSVDFELMWPLPPSIGKHQVDFHWYVRKTAGSAAPIPLNKSVHTICTNWKPLTPIDDEELYTWVYKQPMLWTCQWAAGKGNEKEICDAIIANLFLSGLKYGKRISGSMHPYVRRVLVDGIGMCGEWYHVFQNFSHCQGVYVHRRFYEVDLRSLAGGEKKWHAIVIKSGGLNQAIPTHNASEFHDADSGYPITASTSLVTRNEKRYRFWGPGDGHCINFLVYSGRLYLYDPSFGIGPFEIAPFSGPAAPLPPDDGTTVGGTDLSSFKSQYLNGAVDYMLGTLHDNNGVLRITDQATNTNGISVKTAIVPDTIGSQAEITFNWYSY